MKILTDDQKAVIVIEVVLDPIAVELAIVRIQVDIRHIQVTVGVLPERRIMQDIIQTTTR